jgi:hypothetical protein
MATISTRITLTGGDEVKKQLEALGDAGQKSFKQIQDAAKQTQVDPQKYAQAKQALDGLVTTGTQLANQFLALARAASAFGQQGTQATTAVATGLNQVGQAAQNVGSQMAQAGQQVAAASTGVTSRLISSATAFKLAVVGLVGAVAAITGALTKGAADTGSQIAEQADKLKITVEQWVQLRKVITDAGLSFDDFQKGAGKTISVLDDVQKELDSVFKTFKTADGATATVITMSKLGTETTKTVSELLKLGVSINTLRGGDKLAIMQEIATAISKIPDTTRQAALGVKFFGDSWQDMVKVLTASTKPIDLTGKSIAEIGKINRDMTPEQIETAKKVKDAWTDLGNAIRATRDQIGGVFLSGQLTKTEWLTQLVDGSRELLKTWLGLSTAGKEGFFKDLGESPAETTFKILAALGNQLSSIWNDVLVPAGQSLMATIKEFASGLGDVTSEQAIAFFIALAAAVTALAVAFKGIAFVLSPITALISLFAGFGPILIPLVALVVLFWDQIKDGINAVLALIPNAINGFRQAGEALVRGDWGSAWELFKASAIVAIATIRQAIVQSPIFQPIIKGLETIGAQIPGTIQLIISGLVLLGQAAQGVATAINKVFGTGLTGTDIAALVIIGQLTGGLHTFAAAAVIAGVAFTGIATAIGLVGTAIATVGAAFGLSAATIAGLISGLVAVAAALAAIIIYWPQITQAASAAWEAIKSGADAVKQFITDWVTTPVANAWQWIVDSFNAAIEGVKSAASAAMQAITEWVTTPVANAWQWIVDKWNAMLRALGLGGGGSTSPDGGGGSGFAGGGLLGGRGTGTSDSNLAWVSRGEYIVPASAVAQPGVLALLEALRHTGGNLRGLLNDMGRFAVGGLVTPAFAGGGMAGRDLGTLTLGLPGGSSVTVRASSDVVDQLRRAAAMGQVRSGGRKPSRYS